MRPVPALVSTGIDITYLHKSKFDPATLPDQEIGRKITMP